PKGAPVSRSTRAPLLSQSTSSKINPSTLPNGKSSNSTAKGTGTTPNTVTIQFVNGWPFWFPLGWVDPETLARRQYGPLVTNARYLISAGVFPQAVQLLQRVIAGAPGTRIAAEAERLLATIPE